MPNIYVLLTRSQSLLSRMIHRLTGDSFTHVSLALDSQLQTLCSFARRYSHTPLPAGLVHEDLYSSDDAEWLENDVNSEEYTDNTEE